MQQRFEAIFLPYLVMLLLSTRCLTFVPQQQRLMMCSHRRMLTLRYQQQQQGRYSSGGSWWEESDVSGDDSRNNSGGERRSYFKGSDRPDRGRGPRRNSDYRQGNGNNRGRNGYYKDGPKAQFSVTPVDENRINLRALELAGFDHLYGLSPVLNALQSGRRDITTTMTDADNEDVKPEAQRRPWLLVQTASASTESSRSSEKAAMASKIIEYAKSCNLPIHYVDKGVLNTLSNNRPHQGFVLRCGKLDIPEFDGDFSKHSFWLVLDQVTDPQNLGALLRSAQFLQCPAVLVCTKNSAPPSAAVSAASAGALESYSALYATSILPRMLNTAADDGVRIIGASATAPLDDVPLNDLGNLTPTKEGVTSTALVLGSEGHGLRFSVARTCTEFCRIPGTGGDSLNVSVTGGIFLWQLLQTTRG